MHGRKKKMGFYHQGTKAQRNTRIIICAIHHYSCEIQSNCRFTQIVGAILVIAQNISSRQKLKAPKGNKENSLEP
jgi:hypothetical protein